MAKHDVSKLALTNTAHERFALNSQLPQARGWAAMAHSFNQLATNYRKCLASYSYQFQGLPAAASGTSNHLYFLFRTGENVSKIGAVLGILPAGSASATDPKMRLELYDVSGASTTHGDYVRYNKVDTGTPGVSDLHLAETSIACSANTHYRLSVDVEDYARLEHICAWEVAPIRADDTATGCADPTAFVATGPIYDAGVQKVIQAATNLHKHNSCILHQWSRRSAASAPTISTTTHTNIFDGTTTVSGSSIGVHLDTQYHDTRNQNVQVELAVYATRIAGANNLSVRYQSAGGTLASTGWLSTSGDSVVATTLVANSGATKYDIQARCQDISDGTRWRIDAVALWEYEA